LDGSTVLDVAAVLHRPPKPGQGRRLGNRGRQRPPPGAGAIAADSGRLIAHAGLDRDLHQPDRAEFAVAVADHYQGSGLGRILLGRLIQAADHAGIRWLTGEVLTNNHRMLHLLRHLGCSVSLHLSAGVVMVELPTFASPGVGMVPAA
jgi:GNAT superfamily N-acetyltransferase